MNQQDHLVALQDLKNWLSNFPSIVSTLHYFCIMESLTLHYFLKVDCGLVQWPVCQEQNGT